MALALLPEEHIAPTFDLIVKDAKKKHGKIFVRIHRVDDEGPEEEEIELHDLLNTDSDEETGYHYQANTRDNLTSEDQNRKSTVVSNQIDDVQELGHLHTDAEISEQISRFFSDNDDKWDPSGNDKDLVPWRCNDPNDLGEVDVTNKILFITAKESVEVYIRPATQSSLCDPPATDEGMIDDELTEACTPRNDVASQ
ncbi:hypothetical protein QAD02_006364 [Eretmocerus hayati]|uniref:Uncharacterized protein n=1 Tax=Eretmocerus hayati TaxID=131215 RepID=A0ACC2N119_9HYME|nr:hypothetical protein QAD02_006364 [Eretmocerus hayati]